MPAPPRSAHSAGAAPTGRRSLVQHEDAKLRTYAAWAGLIANYELHARASYTKWGTREIAYLELLQAHGYDPTPWEQAQLETAARETDAGAYRRCAELACTRPTWHDGPCEIDDERADSTESTSDSPDPTEGEEA